MVHILVHQTQIQVCTGLPPSRSLVLTYLPAEWMLEVIGAAPGSHTDIDWYQTWRGSPEYQEVHRELDRLKDELPQLTRLPSMATDKASLREFAAPFTVQLWEVQKRVFEQFWRTPCKLKSTDVLSNVWDD
jgi:ATP-binding cassette subfamily G (WHITE) protein 2 (PDR)